MMSKGKNDDRRKNRIRISIKGLPRGAQRLLKLACAVPEKKAIIKETVQFTEQENKAFQMQAGLIG